MTESKDATFKVELPDRNSTVSPLQTDYSYHKSPVSPQSNRVSSPGLESLKDLVDEKGEYPIVDPAEKEYCPPENTAPEVDERPAEQPRKRKRLKWLFWLTAIVVCIAVGLGVGLGVGLTRHKG